MTERITTHLPVKPKVSAMMLTRNRKQFLREAIKSILNQTYKNFELIIVDNASTDGTKEMVEEEFNDERIVYIRNKENFYPGAVSQVVNLAKGEYIAICDDDDISMPERFEKSVEFFEKNLDVAMIGGGIIFIDKEGDETHRIKYPEAPTFEDIYKSDGMISSPTVMIRKKVIEEVGGYDINFIIAYDYDLYLRIAKEHKIRNLDCFLSKYRIYGGNISLENPLTRRYRERALLKWAKASCLCFSYNRVFQLESYIRSFLKFVEGVQLNVRYQYSKEKYKEGYEKLKEKYPEVNFIEGHELNDFKEQVLDWLKNSPDFVMFGCDDVIFKDYVNIEKVIEKVKLPDTIGFSLRLGKGLTYHFPADKTIKEPEYEESDGILKWNWKGSEGDYGYPFELDASVYKKQFVRFIIDSLSNINWAHPNLFEGISANLVKNLDEPKYLYAFSNPKAVVIQINRVQDLSPNPFYDFGYDVENLFGLWQQGKKLDLDYYHDKKFNSVYIKDFILEGENKIKINGVKITVGIPIWNQRKEYFRECLESIKNQTCDPQIFEVIVLDDGSDNKEEVEKITKEFGFKYIYQKNQGIGSARQAIVDNASKETDFICFLSSDDIWDKDFLKTMLETAKNHPNKILYSHYFFINENGQIVNRFGLPAFNDHEDFCIACWEAASENQMFVNFSSVFISKEVFKKVKFKHRFCEDLYFLLFSMRDFEYYLVNQYLLKYRAAGNLTSRITDKIPKQNKIIRKEAMDFWKNKKWITKEKQ